MVVGAGLGGLAAAIAAGQSGHSVLVLERATGPSEVDTGLTLWAFAMHTLATLGLQAPEKIGQPLERLISFTSDGRLQSDIDLRRPARAVGRPSFEIHRGQLQVALIDLLGPDRIRFGSGCQAVHSDPDRPTAVLSDGAEITAKLIIGADGANSVVRQAVAPKARLKPSNLAFWRGVVELPQTSLAPGHHLRIYGRGVLFGAARLDAERVRWYAGGAIGRQPTGPWAELAARFGAWPDPVPAILEQSRGRPLLFHDAPRLTRLPRLASGRVALVGDAGHTSLPTLGVSGGLALADGLALGQSLVRGTSPSALAAYGRWRGRISRRVQHEARAFALVVAPPRPRVRRLRDRVISPPFAFAQRMTVAHLSRGASAPLLYELLPRPPGDRQPPGPPRPFAG